MTRGHAAPLSAPGSFRCLVCKVYVKGTESGHCPRCGFVPPAARPVMEPRPFPTWLLFGGVIAIAIAVGLVMYA